MKTINTDLMELKCLATQRSPCDSHNDELFCAKGNVSESLWWIMAEKRDYHTSFSIPDSLYVCHSYSYGLRAIIQCLPAWLRFIQCLRRYRDTKRAFPHLVNAGKYSTTFFVVTFAALYATHKGRTQNTQIYVHWDIYVMRHGSCSNIWLELSKYISCHVLLWITQNLRDWS